MYVCVYIVINTIKEKKKMKKQRERGRKREGEDERCKNIYIDKILKRAKEQNYKYASAGLSSPCG